MTLINKMICDGCNEGITGNDSFVIFEYRPGFGRHHERPIELMTKLHAHANPACCDNVKKSLIFPEDSND